MATVGKEKGLDRFWDEPSVPVLLVSFGTGPAASLLFVTARTVAWSSCHDVGHHPETGEIISGNWQCVQFIFVIGEWFIYKISIRYLSFAVIEWAFRLHSLTDPISKRPKQFANSLARWHCSIR
jgi:hypothetical protein